MLEPQTLTLGDWTYKVREPENRPAPLILMLHGWTGDENSMWIFARNFPENIWALAPRAPLKLDQGGYSWRHPRPGSHGWPRFEDFAPSAERVIAFIDRWGELNRVDVAAFDVIGFSQGSAMSSIVAMLYPDRVRKIGLLSGFLPEGSEDHVPALKGKPIFVAHGTQDQLVTVDRARDMVTQLERAGSNVTYCEADVEHKVSSECRRALESFLFA
jgi:phospholipase/carboxylesterase